MVAAGGRDFRRVWAGTGVVTAAESVTEVAMPLVAVLFFDASAFVVAALIATEQAAWLVLGLVSGVLVDRRRRRPVLVSANAVRALLIGSVPVAALLGALTLAQLFVVAALTGVAAVFSTVARQAIVPSVVDRSGLVAANTRLSSTVTAVDLAGKSGAGLLIQWVGAPLALAVDAVGSVAAAVCFGRVDEPPATDPVPRRHFRVEVLEVLRYTLTHPIFRAITFSTAVSNFVTAAQYALLFVFIVRVLDVPTALIGVVLAAASVGGLLGALCTDRLARRFGSGRTWRAGLLVGPLVGLLIPASTAGAGVVLFVVGSFGLSAGLAVVNVIGGSARQAICPPALIGRMSATSMFLTWGLIPIGVLLGGALGSLLSVRAALWITAIGYFLALLVVRLSPLWSVRRIEDMGDTDDTEATGRSGHRPAP